jgi:hypothetical protein
MAYPDYSIVIVSVTTNGVTVDYANAFYNEQLAKKYYNESIKEGKRAFYFEKPQPSKFVRNDIQPLKVNIEERQESVPIASIEAGEEQSAGELLEELKLNIQHEVEDANKTIVTIAKIGVKVATKYWDTFYVGPFKFFKKIFNRTVNEPVGIISTEIVSNKTVVFSHNGNGGYTVQVTKQWPDKDEVTYIPAIELSPINVTTLIGGADRLLGVKRVKFTHDGTPTGGESEDMYTWQPAGFVLHETDTHTYESDGNGWYSMISKEVPDDGGDTGGDDDGDTGGDDDGDTGGDDDGDTGGDTGCPNVGQEVSRTFLQDITVPIETEYGLEYPMIGSEYEVIVINSNCGGDLSTDTVLYPSGTIVYENETTWWKANGEGGVYTESKPNDGGDDDGDDDNGGEEPSCPQEGTVTTSIDPSDDVTEEWSYEGSSGMYVKYQVERQFIADGYCGSDEGQPNNIYIDEGIILAQVPVGTQTHLVITGSNGSWYTEVAYDESEGPYVPDETVPDIQYPQGADCVDPIPAGYGDKISTSCFKSTPNGNIIGTISKREITITLPSGVYYTSTTLPSSPWPPNTLLVTTGGQYFGRKLSAGNCEWVDEAPNVPETWQFPNLCKPAGYYSNKHTIQSSPYKWIFAKFEKVENGVRKWSTWKAYIKHDGKGGVTIEGPIN